MNKILFTVIAMTMLSACSTKPTTVPSSVSPILYNTATADSATVVITRDSGILGSACNTYLFVDGEQVTSLRAADSATLHVPSGRHIISFNTSRGLCPSATDAIDVTLNKGETKRYRIRGDMNGNYQLLPTL